MLENKNRWVQAKLLFALILANFVAQIPYFFHLYYGKQSLAVSARSFLILGCIFAFFMTASVLFFNGRRAGYPLLLGFLTVEFLFYLWGLVSSLVHGIGLFFQIHNPDVLLRIIYSIGYVNFFAAGYFLFLLIRNRGVFHGR